ncbi:CoA-binding protein [Achromobacter denitrificans]|uniref:acetate--CoA ligase family protein n=1 Tax=Achromobacter denitrificans TaxID=32002 RepID=UPI000B4C6A77|nr:acetate--CoA ligase family protein [Achromobacter denitrificans]ASC67895.1 CoA-binding protein [Achromobacter denitrificans]
MTQPQPDQIKADNLGRVFNPKRIALLGATPRAGSFAARTLANLQGYRGELYLVNAKYAEIGGRPCHASLSALPAVPDAVIVALPNPLVEAAVAECAALGVGGVVIYASGYAETGRQADIDAQARLASLARASGLRILGPNCMGLVNYGCGAVQSFQQFPPACEPGAHAIGLISQSGALALSLSQAVERGVSFSHILTFGNGVDVDAADMIEYLSGVEECRAIACVFEGMARPGRLVKAAELAFRRNKPLILCKLATGEQGARAALSHTGALAGAEELYRAALARHGVVFVDRFESLLEVAAFFAKAPEPLAPGAAIVAASGGAGIMAVDKAECHGVPLPAPAPGTRAVLKANIPDFGSASNPCDVTAEVVNNPDSLQACLQAMARDPAYGALVVAQTVAGDAFTPRLKLYSDIQAGHGKPVCAVWLSAWQNGPGSREFERDPRVAVFHSMDTCFYALAQWQLRARLRHAPETVAAAADPAARARVGLALRDVDGPPVLTERESKALLAQYGVAVNREARVDGWPAALERARAIGFPLALKLESPDVLHKTEAGVVRLDIQDEAGLRQAYDEIMANAAMISPPPRIHGLLVQEMVGAGVELIVGARMDPEFGPFIVVGHGGVLVEIIKDPAIAPAPVSPAQARDMLGSLKGAALFDGYRGAEAVDLDALAGLISRISRFIADHRADLSELDINPVICGAGRVVAVDALIIKKQDAGATRDTPKETSA